MITLRLFIEIYFAINFFIAGYACNDQLAFAKTKKDYFISLLHCLFWVNFGLLAIIITIVLKLLQYLYLRSYIHYGFTTLKTWYRFRYKKMEVQLEGPALKAFLGGKLIKRMPKIWKGWWIKFINEEIEKKKKELFEKHGEVTEF